MTIIQEVIKLIGRHETGRIMKFSGKENLRRMLREISKEMDWPKYMTNDVKMALKQFPSIQTLSELQTKINEIVKEQKEKQKIKEIRFLVAKIECLSFENGINPALFRHVLSCFCRTPFVKDDGITSFLKIIYALISQNLDYSLLLKAGILTGQFPDYPYYKKMKRKLALEDNRAKRYLKVLQDMKEKLERKWPEGKYEAEISILNNVPYLNIDITDADWLWQLKDKFSTANRGESDRNNLVNYWKRLSLDKKKIAKELNPANEKLYKNYLNFLAVWDEVRNSFIGERMLKIKEILQINEDEWNCRIDSTASISIFAKNVPSTFIPMKLDPVRSDLPLLSEVFIAKKDYIEKRNYHFISIFQKSIFDHGMYSTESLLKEYFAQKYGKTPTEKEFKCLQQQYYKFIKKSYGSDAQELLSKINEWVPNYYIRSPYRGLREKNMFFLRRCGSRPNRDKSLEEGKLCCDKKSGKYWLMPLSRLSCNIEKIKQVEYPNIVKFFRIHCSAGNITREEGDFYAVRKKIEVKSPSLAAHLVLGYKRNGLTSWKNIDGLTLREFLAGNKKSDSKKS